jgi:hypothetical protein
LILSLISTFWLYVTRNCFTSCEMFHPSSESSVARGTIDWYGTSVEHSMEKALNKYLSKIGQNNIFWLILGLIQIIALFLTFSKSAILGLFLSLAFIEYQIRKLYGCSTWNILTDIWKLNAQLKNTKSELETLNLDKDKIVPRGTISAPGVEQSIMAKSHNMPEYALNKAKIKKGRFFKSPYLKLFLAILLFAVAMLYITKPDMNSILYQSLRERAFYLQNVPRGTFSQLLFGIGSGQYVFSLMNVSAIQNWQFQPIHSLYLLITSELGIVGLILFAWFLWITWKNVPSQSECSTWNILRDKRGTFEGTIFKGLLVGYLFIGLFDHYLWDIQQGQIMLWLILGIIAGLSLKIGEKSEILTK